MYYVFVLSNKSDCEKHDVQKCATPECRIDTSCSIAQHD